MSKQKKRVPEPQDDPQKWIDAYDRYRDELTAKQNSNSDNFDKSILTLSSAGLGLSLTFIKDVTPIGQIASRGVLIGSWGLFSAAIVLTLVSFQCSQQAITQALVDSHDYYVGREKAAIERPNRWNAWTLLLGRIAGVCFILAVLFTAYFVTTNLPAKKPDPAPVVPTVAPTPVVMPVKPFSVAPAAQPATALPPDKPAAPAIPAPTNPAPSSTAPTVAPAPVTPPAAVPQSQSPAAAAPIPPKSP